MNFDRAGAVADAVLYEGYALYPYRASALKNQLRWQFGVLLPRAASEVTKTDPWWLEAQCLASTSGDAEFSGRLRFLRVRRRRIRSPSGESIPSLEADGRLLIPWDEGELCEQDFVVARSGESGEVTIRIDGDETEAPVRNSNGDVIARVMHTRAPLLLRMELQATPVARGYKLRVRVENLSACSAPSGPRDELLPTATLGTHLLLRIEAGEFVSLIDPPGWAAADASACKNVGVYPVLAAEPERGDLMLASPIILEDHPKVAPESPGDLFDATEIDEILSLRTMLLTEDEKREARATDPRVAALIDRVEGLPRETMARLHGTFREVTASPHVRLHGSVVGPGGKVRLRPGPRRTDAQDMFLEGRVATIREIKRDVDGRECLAVTIDDDPAGDLHLWHGRYHYFYLDELEPVP